MKLAMSILMTSRYASARNSHAPGDLRDAFLEALDLLIHAPLGAPPPTAELRGARIQMGALCGLLWNCTDQLPGHVRADLDALGFTGRSSYGAAARWLRRTYQPRSS